MKSALTILGSGTCVSSFYHPFDFRAPPGYLLQYNDKNYLIDCSEGIRQRLERIRFDFYGLDAVFISHFHPDHYNLTSLIQSFMVRAAWVDKPKSLSIYGPSGIAKNFIMMWNAKHPAGDYEKVFPRLVDIRFVEFSDSKSFEIHDISVESFSVFHAYGKLESYAMRFTLGDFVLAYSGDTGVCDGVRKAAKNSDLFLCECSTEIGNDTSLTNGHLNPLQAGLIAYEAKVGKLILTHLKGKDADSSVIENVIRSGFDKEVLLAEDNQTHMLK